MNQEEYELKVEQALQDIPPEFHGALRWIAWDRGHTYGHSEVYNHLLTLVDNLAEPIQKYTERLKNSG